MNKAFDLQITNGIAHLIFDLPQEKVNKDGQIGRCRRVAFEKPLVFALRGLDIPVRLFDTGQE